jgi:hypothetical protein
MVLLLGNRFLACLNKVAVRFRSKKLNTSLLEMAGYFFLTASIKDFSLE